MRKLLTVAMIAMLGVCARPALSVGEQTLQAVINGGYGPALSGQSILIDLSVSGVVHGDEGRISLKGYTPDPNCECDLGGASRPTGLILVGVHVSGVSLEEANRLVGRQIRVTGKVLFGPGLPLPHGVPESTRGLMPSWVVHSARVLEVSPQ